MRQTDPATGKDHPSWTRLSPRPRARPARRTASSRRRPAELAELLKRSGRGDEAAFAALYDAAASRVFGLAVRVVRDPAQAEEVSQEALPRHLAHRRPLRPRRGQRDLAGSSRSCTARPWTGSAPPRRRPGATRRTTSRPSRSTTTRRPRPRRPPSRPAGSAPRSATLTTVQREALELAYFGGYTHTEVATHARPAGRHRQDPHPGRPDPAARHDGSRRMNDIHALSGAYAVDALDDLERAQFARHLAQCAECQAEVASLREAAALLAGPRRSSRRPPCATACWPTSRRSGRCRPSSPRPPRRAAARRRAPAAHPGRGGRRRGRSSAAARPSPGSTCDGATQAAQLTAAERVLAAPDAERVTERLAGGAKATRDRGPGR